MRENVRQTVWLAIWFALLTGLAEAGLLAYARLHLGRYTHLPADLIWISPVGSLLVFVPVAMLLLAAGALGRRPISRRVVIFVFAFLACLDVLFLVTQLHQAAALVLAAGLAVQLERLANRFWPFVHRTVRYSTLPLVVVVVAGGVVFHVMRRHTEKEALSELAAARNGAPNVLLIIWDTVRATNLSLFGYHRPTTPVLERLASESVVFDRAMASAPWTLPSHASLMTGGYPHQLEADWASPLDNKTLTLAEFLRRRGYNTAGFVGNTYYCSEESGLNRGFTHYEDFRRGSLSQLVMGSSIVRIVFGHEAFRHLIGWHEEPGRKNAERINGDVLRWLRGNSDRPFFAFLNYFDAHAPYLPPGPYATRFGTGLPGRNPLISEERHLSAIELRAEEDAYDGAIAYLDHSLGQLLDSLQARGVLDNTIVIVTADHGEQFGEHGLISHGNSLYLPLLHVPLLIRAPGRMPAGVRVHDWVPLRDLATTIAQLISTDYQGAFPGRSLARFWNGAPPVQPETLLAEVSRASGLPIRYPASRGDMRSLIAAPHQYIANTDGTEELYDVNRDPAETRNLLTHPVTAALGNEFRSVLRQASLWHQQ